MTPLWNTMMLKIAEPAKQTVKYTPGPFVADHFSTLPGEPRYRVYSKTTGGNVALFFEEADANLFAATLQMLAALKTIDAWWLSDFPAGPEGDRTWHGLGTTIEIWLGIRAAIAKAEGRADV